MKFWVLWGFDALVALVFVDFFLIGLLDGSVSSFNIVLWLTILASLAGILGGGWLLKAKGHAVFGICVLSLLAIPAFLGLLSFGLILVSHPRWN